MHPADAFLTALGKKRATFQVFPDSEAAANERPVILHGPHRAVARNLAAANERGLGVFTMIAHGDLQGRTAANVTSVAAYFVDLDGAPLPDVWPAPPTLIVESSPGRFHAYWRTTDAPLDAFPRVQKHLALLMDGDPVVHDLPRVMRLPGYKHQKREPFTTRILEQHDDRTYAHDDFAERIALPPAPPPPRPMHPTVAKFVKKHKRRDGKRGTPRDPLDTATERIRTTPPGNRNHTLYRVSCAIANDINRGRVPLTDAEQKLVDAALDAGLPEFEARRTVKSAMRYAQ